MKYRPLGSTGLTVSELGFGCGMVGGILVRGEYPSMRRVVSRAIELGINYFDSAPMYGDGQSEVNLGAVLRELRADVLVGTKVHLRVADLQHIETAVAQSVDQSLRRLGRGHIDLIQLHNPLDVPGPGDWAPMAVKDLAAVTRAFQSLQGQGKVRFWGITALGQTDALHQAVAAGGFHTIQTVYNLLNPSAAAPLPPEFPFQDYRQLIARAADRGIGVIVIRALAGGALAGTADRHPTAAPAVDPIGSGQAYDADVARARAFALLRDSGMVRSLVEAAIRFVLSRPEVSTALVGISSPEQLEHAVESANRGPLPADALARIHDVQARFAKGGPA
jgi:aryl-alcohol dehydrogenase-like predicted oxidoreductase